MKVKEFYKIGEISKLYGIGTDSLRYYEKLGILKPKRDDNGYRMYNISDICTLNILRELRAIGFSLEEIKTHLTDFNLEKTLSLFGKELEYIDKKAAELKSLKNQLINRIEEIEIHKDEKRPKELVIKKLSERKILKLSENVYRDKDLDFVIKKLQKKNEDQIYIVGNGDIGSTIPLERLEQGRYGKFTSVFFITQNHVFDQVISEGKYLSMVVKGAYDKMPESWKEMFDYMKKNNLKAAGDPMELYVIDNHATNDENEFITELQILLK